MHTTPVSSMARSARRGQRRRQEQQARAFAAVAQAYQASPDSFYAAWQFLRQHPIVAGEDNRSRLTEALDIWVAKVDPVTRQVADDAGRNTHTEIWLELGPVYWQRDAPGDCKALFEEAQCTAVVTHDYALDCGGDTFEEAVISLARLVHEQYGPDRSHVYDQH